MQGSIEGGSRNEAAASPGMEVRAPPGGNLTPSVAMSRSAYSAATSKLNLAQRRQALEALAEAAGVAEGVGSGSGGSATGAREPGASRAKVARGEARSERRVREDALGEIGHGKVERRVLRRAYGLASDVRVHRLEHLAHELLAHPRQARRLATRVSGHALGPWAALAALFSLRYLRHLTALRRVWLLSG